MRGILLNENWHRAVQPRGTPASHESVNGQSPSDYFAVDIDPKPTVYCTKIASEITELFTSETKGLNFNLVIRLIHK